MDFTAPADSLRMDEIARQEDYRRIRRIASSIEKSRLADHRGTHVVDALCTQ